MSLGVLKEEKSLCWSPKSYQDNPRNGLHKIELSTNLPWWLALIQLTHGWFRSIRGSEKGLCEGRWPLGCKLLFSKKRLYGRDIWQAGSRGIYVCVYI